MRTITKQVVAEFSRKAALAIWVGPAQTGGHRSDDVQFLHTLDGIVRYVKTQGTDHPAPEVAGTVLYRFADGQPFGDCNKRTGLIIATQLMESAGYRLTRPDREVWEYLNLFATNHPEKVRFLQWFKKSFARANDSPTVLRHE